MVKIALNAEFSVVLYATIACERNAKSTTQRCERSVYSWRKIPLPKLCINKKEGVVTGSVPKGTGISWQILKVHVDICTAYIVKSYVK